MYLLNETYAFFLYNLQGGTQVSKLDKADILEMTVSHLRQIHHQQLSAAMAASSGVVQQYREGYLDCAGEAVRYMEASRAYPNEMVMRVRTNLAHKMGYSLGSSHYSESYKSALEVSANNDLSPPNTPVKVKVESPSSCVSVSPDSGIDSAFSPLLMTVPSMKREVDLSGVSLRMNNSSDDSVIGHEADDTHSHVVRPGTSKCSPSQSPVLSLPARVPASVNDSPSQKQVWRPF